MPHEEIEQLRAVLEGADSGFAGVWPDNRAAINVFVAGQSQWRTGLRMTDHGPRTLWIGLDYAAVKIAAEIEGLPLDAGIFAGLRLVELGARAALNGEAS